MFGQWMGSARRWARPACGPDLLRRACSSTFLLATPRRCRVLLTKVDSSNERPGDGFSYPT